MLFNPEAYAINLARPYRTIDGHPVLICAPRFEADKTTAQRETSDARRNFEQKVGPMLHAIKGLAGTGETTPSFITDPLIQVILAYMSFNPLSKELMKIVDLGCGTGALLRRILIKVLDKCPIDETFNLYALLNDDTHADPGKRLRFLSLEEPYAGLFDSRAWKGDMRRLVTELDSFNERFDIAFINRVLTCTGAMEYLNSSSFPKR